MRAAFLKEDNLSLTVTFPFLYKAKIKRRGEGAIKYLNLSGSFSVQ